MKNNERDIVRLNHIKDAISLIQQFTKGVTIGRFMKDQMRQAAVIREFEIIGEAVGKISKKMQRDYPNVEWAKINGFRNLLIHEYFRVDTGEIWATIQIDIPILKEQIAEIITDLA